MGIDSLMDVNCGPGCVVPDGTFFSLLSEDSLLSTLCSRSSPLLSLAVVPGKAGSWESCTEDRLCKIHIDMKR